MGCIKLSILDEQYKTGIRLSSFAEELTSIFCAKTERRDIVVKYIDPSGMTVEPTGDVDGVVKQMQGYTKNLTFGLKDGKVEIVKGKARTKEEKYMAQIINDKSINVKVSTMNSKVGDGGGAFWGNSLDQDYLSDDIEDFHNTAITTVNATQLVNLNQLASSEGEITSGCRKGSLIWHEIAEGYEGGKISRATNTPAQPAYNYGKGNSIFWQAHYNAGEYFPGHMNPIKISDEKVIVPEFRDILGKTIFPGITAPARYGYELIRGPKP